MSERLPLLRVVKHRYQVRELQHEYPDDLVVAEGDMHLGLRYRGIIDHGYWTVDPEIAAWWQEVQACAIPEEASE